MTQSVAPDQKDVFVTVRMITDADGIPATGVVAATAGHQIWYRRDGAADVDDVTSAADLASLTTGHTDWEFLHIRAGYYTVAFPDAAFIKGVGNVLCGMEATGISCVAESVIIDKFLKFQGKVVAATATTTEFPAGTLVKKGDEIYVLFGTGERQTRLVLSVSGEVATHLAFSPAISTTTSTVALVPGDETLALGGINTDVVLSTRSDLSTTDVDSSVVAGVSTIKAKTDQLIFTVANKLDSNAKSMNDTPLIGTGIVSDKFRGNPP